MRMHEALLNASRLTKRAAVLCICLLSICSYSTYSSGSIKQRAVSANTSSSNPWADSSSTDNYSLQYSKPDHNEEQQHRDSSTYSPTYSSVHSPVAEQFAVVNDSYDDNDGVYDEPDALNESIGSATSPHSGNSWLATAQHNSSSSRIAIGAAQHNRAVAATAIVADTAHTGMMQSTTSQRAVSPVQQSPAVLMRNTDEQASAVSPQRRSPKLSPQQQQQQQRTAADHRIGTSQKSSSSSSAVRSSHNAATMHAMRADDSSARHRPATAGDARYDVTSDVALQHAGASPQRLPVRARPVNSSGSSSSAALVSPRQLRQTAASRIQAALAETDSKSTRTASSSKLQHSSSISEQPISSYTVPHRERLAATACASADAYGASTTSASSSTVQCRTTVSPQQASPPLSPLLVMEEDDEPFNTIARDNR
jgi:hypothetical protein